ncbi:MAG: ATP-dependent DNA helicase [Rhodospirillales bacterium]|nr:ATP-dependent DNA helicase [Rhodospirillales bacterium]
MIAATRIRLPDASVLVAGSRTAALLSPDGEVETMTPAAAARLARGAAPILCHRAATAARLGVDPFPAFDLLELYAFVRPARFCLPTPRGLAAALGVPLAGGGPEPAAAALYEVAWTLLGELGGMAGREGGRALADTAWAMARGGWNWGPFVLAALGAAETAGRPAGLRVWERLPEWSEHAPEAPPGSEPVEPAEARSRLAAMLGPAAEQRPQQADYASAVCPAFRPRERQAEPSAVLAEAGTGTGKTLGYVAAASLWAEKNRGPVWISTYTRNLQRQLDVELDRLFPDASLKARRVVVRKGRENYLCLLNLEEAVQRLGTAPSDAVPVGLMVRWAAATRDGDMVGGDFPGWLGELLGRSRTLALADRRGECIHAACPHYRKCFIERTVRRARRADIVIANHALVMVQAALGGLDDGALPTRYVFDEGHHLFEAADGAFSAHLSGLEAAELRRWLLGPEGEARSRARGLKRRTEELCGEDDLAEVLDEALQAAHVLPSPGWHQRVAEAAPRGVAEAFLALVRQQVYARASGLDAPYSLETTTQSPVPGLVEAATELRRALERLAVPLRKLAAGLANKLDDEAADLDASTRQRIEAVCRTIERRALLPLAGWRDMLGRLESSEPAEDFVDWFGVERIEGRDVDVGLHRHWRDPTIPFARSVAEQAHGLLITSATLRDGSGDVEADWRAAERRTGTVHLARPAMRAAVPSPFDYALQTRVFIVTDVRKDDLDQVAAAYRELFLASGGGGLGLFTAISRLRGVHRRIAGPLEAAGVPLLAQHVEAMDTATIVDIFRAEEDACLLGTDAVRDGVDVPGRSLRLLVFDRVPWPRPDILHKARRAVFGGKDYDDMLTRLRLKQAFGRLVRRADDAGVFVLLDPMMPSRLSGAFPEGVTPVRLGLAEAVAETRSFLHSHHKG